MGKNPKSESRNSKQARIAKKEENSKHFVFDYFPVWRIRICFGFRNSYFGFGRDSQLSLGLRSCGWRKEGVSLDVEVQ